MDFCMVGMFLFQLGDANIAREADPSVPSKDDIPTFDEWKKQVMEVEKEKSKCIQTRHEKKVEDPVKCDLKWLNKLRCIHSVTG